MLPARQSVIFTQVFHDRCRKARRENYLDQSNVMKCVLRESIVTFERNFSQIFSQIVQLRFFDLYTKILSWWTCDVIYNAFREKNINYGKKL